MNGKVLSLNGIIVVLGIASAVIGFLAEANKIQKSEVFITHFSCVYPHSSSPGLGIVAAFCTIINQLILLVLVGCCCCRSRVYTSTPISSFFNILSWIASIIAVSLLLAAAKLSNREGGESDSNGRTTCYVVKPGIFAAGAVLSLLSAVFGIVAYDSFSSAKQTTLKPELALPVAYNVDPETTATRPQQYQES